MILTKIMSNQIADAKILIEGKLGNTFNRALEENTMMERLVYIYERKSLIELYQLFQEFAVVIHRNKTI